MIKSWTESKTIRYLFFTWLGSFLLQIVPMIQKHSFDLWELFAQAVFTFAGILIRMGKDDIVAPKVLNTISSGILNINTTQKEIPIKDKDSKD